MSSAMRARRAPAAARGGELGGERLLVPLPGAEPARARTIHDQEHRQLALLDVALDEETAHPRAHVPVDRAHFVAGLVFAHLGELHALPLEHGVVLADEARVHQAARTQLDALDLAQDLRRNGVAFTHLAHSSLLTPHYGDGTASSTRATTWSLVTLSASASYVSRTRWRRTSGAMAFPSSGA